jgi:hypothetical protein
MVEGPAGQLAERDERPGCPDTHPDGDARGQHAHRSDEHFDTGEPCGFVGLGRVEGADVPASRPPANAERIAPEAHHCQHGEPCEDHGEQPDVLSKPVKEHRIDAIAGREQQRVHEGERDADRQQRQPAGAQLVPHLRSRRRRDGTREPEQADEPMREPVAGSPGKSRPPIPAALTRHGGHGQPERRQANRGQ